MSIPFEVTMNDVISLLAALAAGSIIGVEREYRSKAAGFRTMSLICLGSALFTMLSQKLGAPNNSDRIASNIITGIGFIGAGAIFKDGFGVTGLTTATSIWITSALGMAIGAHDFGLSFIAALIVFVILTLFDRIETIIDNIHQRRTYRFSYRIHQLEMDQLEQAITACGVRFVLKKVTRDTQNITCWYDIHGSKVKLKAFDDFLMHYAEIDSFEH